MKTTSKQGYNLPLSGSLRNAFCVSCKPSLYIIPSVVSRSDLNIVHWEMNPLVGVGESYNKAFEYFAAGKPVFYTIRPGYSIVEKYHCGRLTEGFTAQDLSNGIESMAAMSSDEKKQMKENARKAAEIYDFAELTKKLIKIIEK